MAGINFADSEYVFFSDVDLQDPPELLEQMFEKITQSKLDAVFGKRSKNKENFFKKYSSIAFYKFFNVISNTKISEQTSDFILINQKVLMELKKIKDKVITSLLLLIMFLNFRDVMVDLSLNVPTSHIIEESMIVLLAGLMAVYLIFDMRKRTRKTKLLLAELNTANARLSSMTVSYTHLTLPTICSV